VRFRGLRISVSTGFLVAASAATPALAANQTVSATPANQFSPKDVTLSQGEMVTWNNTGGVHNVHFDDGTFDMPASPSSGWSGVTRTFPGPGTFRYYCELHGGPGGAGMSGTVTVNGPGYPRPRGATPLRASLAPAYKPCPGASANRTHGAPLSNPSCNPPVQVSDFLTVGSPDANSRAVNSLGSVTLSVLSAPGDLRIASSITDVRKKSDLSDYTGELQAKLPLRITDKYNGPSLTEPATGDTSLSVAFPCTATGPPADITLGSTCTITTTANAVAPGAVIDGNRAIWQLTNVEVYDGGADGLASTAGNTLFADQAVFVP
jgi:plastocyanin